MMNEALLLLLLLLPATYWPTLATTEITRNTCSSTNRLHAYDRTVTALEKVRLGRKINSLGTPPAVFSTAKAKRWGTKTYFP